MGIISLAVMYSAPSSASATDDITNLIICGIVRTSSFHLGVGMSLDKIYGPLRGFGTWNLC